MMGRLFHIKNACLTINLIFKIYVFIEIFFLNNVFIEKIISKSCNLIMKAINTRRLLR